MQEAVLANASAPGQAADDREPINNVQALEEALEDIAWPPTVGWLEAQVRTVVAHTPLGARDWLRHGCMHSREA